MRKAGVAGMLIVQGVGPSRDVRQTPRKFAARDRRT